MLNSLKDIFNITNRYIILATPLILFSLFSTIYLAISGYGSGIKILVALILFGLMFATFIAGWGKMLKVAVVEPCKEDANSILKEFPIGVGEYFLQTTGSIILISVVSILILVITIFAGLKFIGNPNIPVQALSESLKNPEMFKIFLSSLSKDQIAKISMWNFAFILSVSINYFLFMLYYPTIFFQTKNPVIAFFINLKNIFSKKILKTLAIFISIFITYLIISVLATLSVNNLILHLIITLINFYYLVYISVGIFYYYYHEFVDNHLGQNIDTKV